MLGLKKKAREGREEEKYSISLPSPHPLALFEFLQLTNFYEIQCGNRASRNICTPKENASNAGQPVNQPVSMLLKSPFTGTQRLFSVKYLFGEANIT